VVSAFRVVSVAADAELDYSPTGQRHAARTRGGSGAIQRRRQTWAKQAHARRASRFGPRPGLNRDLGMDQGMDQGLPRARLGAGKANLIQLRANGASNVDCYCRTAP